MRSELFEYDLPPSRIAQTPLEPRDASRLLYLPADGPLEHRQFLDLPELLRPDDLLVLNDTRVLPARLHGRKSTGGRVEIVLLRRLRAGCWEGLVYPGRRLREGDRVEIDGGELTAHVVERAEDGTRTLRFEGEGSLEDTDAAIHRLGSVPLPPYIHETLDDPERYQTLYAREEGSAAAPTAGLHFTPRIFAALQERGIRIAFLTLHVGLATFRPIKTEAIEDHAMHGEWYTLPEETAAAVAACSGRVVAVGTTTLRCLESAAIATGQTGRVVQAGTACTHLYVTPGFPFQVVDALVTNFHTPRSTLLVLVSAFAGRERVLEAYTAAVAEGYRFFSFGDAMLVERSAV